MTSPRSLYKVGERLLELFRDGEATVDEVNSLLAQRAELMKSTAAQVLTSRETLLQQDSELLVLAHDYFQRLRSLISLTKPNEQAINPARFMDFRA